MKKSKSITSLINKPSVYVYDEGMAELRAAIVLQALSDYVNPNTKQRYCNKNDVIRFFKSDWCKELIGIDSDLLIKRAKELAQEKKIKK